MLYIKRLNTQSVITFREQEHVISPSFLTGGVLAIAFHLVLFLSFKIVHPKAYESVEPIPSLYVEVEHQTSIFHTHLETACLDYQDEPVLPTPFIAVPVGSNYEKSAYSLPDFVLTETLDYESLDIDFNDDRD